MLTQQQKHSYTNPRFTNRHQYKRKTVRYDIFSQLFIYIQIFIMLINTILTLLIKWALPKQLLRQHDSQEDLNIPRTQIQNTTSVSPSLSLSLFHFSSGSQLPLPPPTPTVITAHCFVSTHPPGLRVACNAAATDAVSLAGASQGQ